MIYTTTRLEDLRAIKDKIDNLIYRIESEREILPPKKEDVLK